jgi:NAD(P)-dependent dehydrogenase (short-subunit alcohol dehydrogenase family)
MKTSQGIKGGTALVTGGGSGIGRSVALAFHARGANVLVADINQAGAEETATMIEKAGGKAVAFRVDVANAASVEAMVSRAVERFGRLDFAANCAGVAAAMKSTAEHTEESWDHTMAVNLKGVWLCMKYELAQMLKQGGGAIVNIASTAGLVGGPMASAYVASKHGVVGLTRTAAIEYVKDNIRINSVCPGYIDTPMARAAIDAMPGMTEEDAAKFNPIGRMGKPQEIADAVIWLCSEQSSFVLGAALAVDGGITAI